MKDEIPTELVELEKFLGELRTIMAKQYDANTIAQAVFTRRDAIAPFHAFIRGMMYGL